jgi:DNA-binding protein Fis
MDALSYHKGNRTHTAKALGISIRTLRNKLADFRKMGIYL